MGFLSPIYPLLSQERVKLRTSNFVPHSQYRSEQKPITNFWKSSRVHIGLSKLLSAPIYWGHRAVFFAIAQLSCTHTCSTVHYKALSTLSQKSATVAENGETTATIALFCDSCCFRRQIVAEIGDYSRQCGQALRRRCVFNVLCSVLVYAYTCCAWGETRLG